MADQTRKTDRRTLYTQRAIKDALLEVIGEKRFDKVTVTDVCRRAEITRATFYLHYKNLAEVLDAILDEALAEDDVPGTQGATDEVCQGEAAGLVQLPMCQRVSSNPRYLPLFKDSSVTDYLVERLYQTEGPHHVPELMERTGLPKRQAELLVRFKIFGSFSVNSALGWKKDQEWRDMQDLIGAFCNAGEAGVSRRGVE